MRTVTLALLCFVFLFTQCYAPQWAADSKEVAAAPPSIQSAFQKYPNGIMALEVSSPGFSYAFDIGEKDAAYHTSTGAMIFEKVDIELLEEMPKGSIWCNISFTDKVGNVAKVEKLDLMRLIPQYDTRGDMLYSEVILEEFNRFGVVFRREHNEFELQVNSKVKAIQDVAARTSRMNITNNCLEPTKWEMVLTSEDFRDFGDRLKSDINLNQNKILAHCWFYLDKDLYEALQVYKNPEIERNYFLPYDSLNDLGEATVIDFETMRYPLDKTLKTKVLEIGHQSNRLLEPVDVEEFYKWQFGLFLNRKEGATYQSVLEEPVQIARFSEAGFYNAETPNIYNVEFLKYIDKVNITMVDAPNSDCYAEIRLTGDYAPYEIVIGNLDLAFPDEQKLTGMLFGYNTYPKSRRYNPRQRTLFFDADDYPEKLKPYLLMIDKKTGKWINNQKKGVEKLYFSYENIERSILQIYVLSYERVTPLWMARVKLPNTTREAVRMRRRLYAY